MSVLSGLTQEKITIAFFSSGQTKLSVIYVFSNRKRVSVERGSSSFLGRVFYCHDFTESPPNKLSWESAGLLSARSRVQTQAGPTQYSESAAL